MFGWLKGERERENLLPGNRYFSVCTDRLNGAAREKKREVIWLLYILCNMLHGKLYLQFVNWRQKIDALNVKKLKWAIKGGADV